MTITDKLLQRLKKYVDSKDESLHSVAREIDREVNLTTVSIKNFYYGNSKGNGATIDKLDQFLTKRGF